LETHKVRYVLVGAIALAARGLPRTTEDVDLFVDPGQDNVTSLVKALASVWDDPELSKITSSDLAGDYPVIRYGPPDESFLVDIMSRLGTAFKYEDLASEVIELEGVRITVATPGTLYKMKRSTLRKQDIADAEALKARFDLRDEDNG